MEPRRLRSPRSALWLVCAALLACSESGSPSSAPAAPETGGEEVTARGTSAVPDFLLDRIGQSVIDAPWVAGSPWPPTRLTIGPGAHEPYLQGVVACSLPAAAQMDREGEPLLARWEDDGADAVIFPARTPVDVTRLRAFDGFPRPPNALGQRRVVVREECVVPLDLGRSPFQSRLVVVVGPGSGATSEEVGAEPPQIVVRSGGEELARHRLDPARGIHSFSVELPSEDAPGKGLEFEFLGVDGRSGDREIALHGMELQDPAGRDRVLCEEAKLPRRLLVAFEPPPETIPIPGDGGRERRLAVVMDEGPAFVRLEKAAAFELWLDGAKVAETGASPRPELAFHNPEPRAVALMLRFAEPSSTAAWLHTPRALFRSDPEVVRGREGAPLGHPMLRHLSLNGDTRRSLLLVAGSEVEIPMDWSVGDRLELAVGSHDVAGRGRRGDALALELAVTPGTGAPQVLGTAQVSPGPEWLPLNIPLPARSRSGEGALRLRLLAPPKGRSRTAGFVVGLAEPRVVRPPVDPAPPAVIVFLTDTLRADRLGCYGHDRDTSPRLDALAREGIVFENAASQASWTKPSVASIFTGLLQSFHGAGKDNTLGASSLTLAEAFRQAGFTTGAFVANPYVHARGLNFEQGFGQFVAIPAPMTAKEVVDAALPWIDAHQDRPFFLYLHTIDPHEPYEPPSPAAGRFRDADYQGSIQPQHTFAKTLRRQGLSEADVQRVLDLYDEEVYFNDLHLGRLLDHLEARGMSERTWIVFVSDHGEMLGTHRDWGHGRELWQELLHVPLVMKVPGGPAGRRVSEPVGANCLLPTFAAAFDLPLPQPTQGVDLLSVLEREPGADFGVIAEDPPILRSLLDGEHKLIERTAEPTPRLELYDLSTDGDELRDLAAEQPDRVRRLQQRLQDVLARGEELGLRQEAGGQHELSDEQRAALQALGYLDEDEDENEDQDEARGRDRDE